MMMIIMDNDDGDVADDEVPMCRQGEGGRPLRTMYCVCWWMAPGGALDELYKIPHGRVSQFS